MRFADKEIKISGGEKFKGQSHTVTVSTPEYESYAEALQALGGEDTALKLINDFISNRAPSGFRSSVANFIKSTDQDWPAVVRFAEERAPSVKEYTYSGDRGPSRKKQHEMIDALSAEKVQTMSAEELRAYLANLAGLNL